MFSGVSFGDGHLQHSNDSISSLRQSSGVQNPTSGSQENISLRGRGRSKKLTRRHSYHKGTNKYNPIRQTDPHAISKSGRSPFCESWYWHTVSVIGFSANSNIFCQYNQSYPTGLTIDPCGSIISNHYTSHGELSQPKCFELKNAPGDLDNVDTAKWDTPEPTLLPPELPMQPPVKSNHENLNSSLPFSFTGSNASD